METRFGRERSKNKVSDWLILCVPVSITAIVLEFFAVPEKWEAVLLGTVAVFAAVLMVFRSAWRNVEFWRWFTLPFAIHIVLTLPIAHWQLRPEAKIPWGLVFLIVLIEYFGICVFLERRLSDSD